jgi:hypothetical protein
LSATQNQIASVIVVVDARKRKNAKTQKGCFMATCQDLVNAVSLIYTAVNGVSVNLDAIREKLICIEEKITQSQTTREFKAQKAELEQKIEIQKTEALCKAMNALATSISGQNAPAPSNVTMSNIAASDLSSFPPCSSQLYCPPGLVKNEEGECVEPPE